MREAYLQAAEREPRAHVFDAALPFDELQQALRERVLTMTAGGRA